MVLAERGAVQRQLGFLAWMMVAAQRYEVLQASSPSPSRARGRLMRRTPKKHSWLPPEQQLCLLYRLRPRRADGT